jgi:pyruvate-formate lyase-activating enzyme
MDGELLKWTENYIQFKHSFYGNRCEIEMLNDCMQIRYKNKIEEYIPCDNIVKFDFKRFNDNNKKILIIKNEKNNIKNVVKVWNKLKKIHNLMILFVDFARNSKWVLHPNAHDKISEDNRIEDTLLKLHEQAMAEC